MSNLNITDLSNDFSAHPLTADVSVKKNAEAIKQSLKNLLFLNKFDKPFDPNLDSGLRELLFENFPEPFLQDAIEKKVQYIISRYEPRVRPLSIIVRRLEDANTLQIEINYKIRNQEELAPQTLQIAIERIR
jgi:phage baseplate assembly protein W